MNSQQNSSCATTDTSAGRNKKGRNTVFGRETNFSDVRQGCLLAGFIKEHVSIPNQVKSCLNMRHIDLNLIMSLYAHTLRGQDYQAVENLPWLSSPGQGSQKAAATDNRSVGDYKPAYRKF